MEDADSASLRQDGGEQLTMSVDLYLSACANGEKQGITRQHLLFEGIVFETLVQV